MLRILLPALLIACFLQSSAQIPAGYYDSAYNGAVPKTCADLKTALFKIISADTNYLPYNGASGAYDTQDALNRIDIHRNDANTADIIWDMYTDNPTGPELYTFTPVTDQCGSSFPPQVGACYNREHSFPRSWFGDDPHMRGDLHALFATDGETNARHANYAYAQVGTASWTSPAGSKLGTCSFPGFTGTVFEPIDAYKGDFARAMFFFVTCYENLMPAWQSNGNADDVLNGTTWPSLDNWAIKQWYQWHIQDPVSQKELTRNDSVFAIQGNRNPFIDHPEYVALIWQCTGLLPVTLTDFTAVKDNGNVLLQWHVTSETNFRQYEVERSSDGRNFIKIGVVGGSNRNTYNLTDYNLPASATTVFYRLKMVDTDGKFIYSKVAVIKLNAKSFVTLYPNPAANELNILFKQPLSVAGTIKVTDVAGKELIRVNAPALRNNIQLNVQHLPAGRYIVSVISSDMIQHEQLVIVR